MDGVSSLNETELLAILIGSGLRGRSAETVASELLEMTDHDLQTLGKLTPEGYAQIPGIGKARSTLISAAILFFLGSGPVKGFAVTLGIGILTTLFSAYFLARHITSLIILNKKESSISL